MITATYAEARRHLRYQKCFRHPDNHLEIQVVRTTGDYVPWCPDCYQEGYSGPPWGTLTQ